MVVSRVFPYAGSGYLISSPNSVLFLRSATAPVAAELWQHLRGSAGFSRVLSSLLERAELDFTFATAAADATLVVARGFVVNDADGGLLADGVSALTWAEAKAPADARIILGESGEPTELPLRDGVTRAAGAMVEFGLADEEVSGADEPLSELQQALAPVLANDTPSLSGATIPTELADEAPAFAESSGLGGAAEFALPTDISEQPEEFLNPSTDEQSFAQAQPGQVLATLCDAGHPNPPGRAICERCGAELNNPLVSIDQPTIGELLFSHGERVELENDVIVGRRPCGEARPGRKTPFFVKVPSPNQEISRVHCEVRVEGWSAEVVDRDSNNGTYVLRAGEDPVRVAPEHPLKLVHGDVVDLGENVTFQVRLYF